MKVLGALTVALWVCVLFGPQVCGIPILTSYPAESAHSKGDAEVERFVQTMQAPTAPTPAAPTPAPEEKDESEAAEAKLKAEEETKAAAEEQSKIDESEKDALKVEPATGPADPKFDACFQWQQLASLGDGPKPRPGEGFTSLFDRDGALTLFGGCSAKSLSDCSPDMFTFDPLSRVWAKQQIFNSNNQEFSLKARGMASAWHNDTNSLYVFGGSRDGGSNALTNSYTEAFPFSNSLDMLYQDPKNKPGVWTWKHIDITGEKPPVRQDSLMLATNTTLVMWGGFSDMGFFTDVWSIDLTANINDWRWVKQEVFGLAPAGRKGASASLYTHNKILMFGGSGESSALNDVWVLSVNPGGRWFWSQPTISVTSSFSKPAARTSATITLWKRPNFPPILALFGGCDLGNNKCYNDIHLLDTSSWTWLNPTSSSDFLKTELPSGPAAYRRPTARRQHTVLLNAKNNMIYVIGGCSQEECYNDVFRLDLGAVCPGKCGEFGVYNALKKKCDCKGDYMGKLCDKRAPTCPNECGAPNGECVVENYFHMCKCKNGFWGVDCTIKPCPGNCTSHGICNKAGQCECGSDWQGDDCSQAKAGIPPATPMCKHHCSGHGECLFGGLCKCEKGFGGDHCQHECPLHCSDEGVCGEDGKCICNKGRRGASCIQTHCGDDTCSLKGACVDDKCVCQKPFLGAYCEIDPACGGKGQFVNGKCRCEAGWSPPDCRREIYCTNNCTGHGACSGDGKYEDPADPFEARRQKLTKKMNEENEERQRQEDLKVEPRFMQQFEGDNVTHVIGVCTCDQFHKGADCSVQLCDKDCSNHGRCYPPVEKDEMGVCECFPGYAGANCNVTLDCPQNCTTLDQGLCKGTQVVAKDNSFTWKAECHCKGKWGGAACERLACPKECVDEKHGTCNNGKCLCKPGFSGLDCSQECPELCSGQGNCVGGNCTCDEGWEGPGCNVKKACPSVEGKVCAGNGFCHAVSKTCFCRPGFDGADCSTSADTCGDGCNDRGVCKFNHCFCAFGYEGEHCETEKQCLEDCHHQGVCKNHECVCHQGFKGKYCDERIPDYGCLNNCTGNGVCLFGRCHCAGEFSGEDCSEVEGFCKGQICSGNGICSQGKCFCFPGFKGEMCSSNDDCVCENGGVCISAKCRCQSGFTGDHCEKKVTCPSGFKGPCMNHGICVEGKCACEPGFTGADCGTLVEGRLPCGGNNCSNLGICEDMKCLCLPGHGGDDCSLTSPISCPADCKGHGTCLYGQCYCHIGFSGPDCGTEANCGPHCEANGVCLHGTQCICAPGYEGEQCTLRVKTPHEIFDEQRDAALRNRENKLDDCAGLNRCSFRGLCAKAKDTKGTEIHACNCQQGWAGADCSRLIGGRLSERCADNCGEKGVCRFGECVCDPGWIGKTCNIKVELGCEADCSGHGTCHYGTCVCHPQWSGKNCSVASKCDPPCGEHGVCLKDSCLCVQGYEGQDCNQAIAAEGAAPSLIEDNDQTIAADESPKTEEPEVPAKPTIATPITAIVEPKTELPNISIHAAVETVDPPLPAGYYHSALSPFLLAMFCFVGGVASASGVRYLSEKRAEMRRQAMLKPLLLEK